MAEWIMVGLAPRSYVIEEYTKTVCPHCAEEGPLRSDGDETWCDGMLVTHDGKVWMRRTCRKHGETESLYEEDAEVWRSRHGWQTPTLEVIPDRPENARPFPDGYRDGLPKGHGQHSCITLLNVTESCNYKCPTCYAEALEPGDNRGVARQPNLDDMLHSVDTVIEREQGKVSVVMLSGGEPTVRDDLEVLIEELKKRPVTRIMVNTNGRRIVRDQAFARFLADHRDRVEVYLQFDGLRDSTYEALRGQKLAQEKLDTLSTLSQLEVSTTLVATVKRGVNEDEAADLVALGLETPFCTAVAFQPVFGSGRGSGIDPQDRTTPTGLVKRLKPHLAAQDFIPLPCSHRDCCDIAYLLRDEKGVWKSLVQIVGREELKKWIHLASNTISFEDVRDTLKSMVKDGPLQRLFSEQQKAGSLQTVKDLVTMCGCVPGINELLGSFWNAKLSEDEYMKRLMSRTFRVTVKMFMDANTFHEHRIRQCCVHVPTQEEDPRRYSFCWRWLFQDATDRPGLTPLPRL